MLDLRLGLKLESKDALNTFFSLGKREGESRFWFGSRSLRSYLERSRHGGCQQSNPLHNVVLNEIKPCLVASNVFQRCIALGRGCDCDAKLPWKLNTCTLLGSLIPLEICDTSSARPDKHTWWIFHLGMCI